jgi:2-keto-4-pentenoate hydratase
VNGSVECSLSAEDTGAHLIDMVEVVGGRLGDAGEELRPGDRIITGILAPPHEAQPGDTVRLELEAVGGVELRFAA